MALTIPTIRQDRVQGGYRGEQVAWRAEIATKQFFSLGVENIERECNLIRIKYDSEWANQPQEALVTSLGTLSITYANARAELKEPFDLFQPDLIQFVIKNEAFPQNPQLAAHQNFIGSGRIL
jgi:hypothetical protein